MCARPEKQSACARGLEVLCLPGLAAHTRTQWASPERRRSPPGGGAGAAWQPPYGSVEPPPVSGTGAAGRSRQRPALQRVRTSCLLPPSFLRPPAVRVLAAEEAFSWEVLRLGRGLKSNILMGSKAWRLLRLPLAPLVVPSNILAPDPVEWRSAPFMGFR